MPHNTRRMNRLEELGRVDAERGFTRRGRRNLRDERRRIVSGLRGGGIAKRGKGLLWTKVVTLNLWVQLREAAEPLKDSES